MSRAQFKRRKVFINQSIQARYIIGVFLMILLSGLCSALLIFWITGGDLQAQSQSAHASIVNAWDRLGLSILIGNVVSIVIAGTISMFVVLYASHKIVGPMYRFKKICEQVGAGNLDTQLSLREKDQLQELGLAFSDMVHKLRTKKAQQLDLVAQINIQIEQLKLDQNITEQQLDQVNELKRLVLKL
jgi:methyl-accepting chemotaxis protein